MSELWELALSDLRGRLSAESFETWLSPIQFDGIDGETVQLRIPNRFCADWIRSHYLDLILESLCDKTGSDSLDADLKIDEGLADRFDHNKSSPSSAPPPRNRSSAPKREATGLNPKYRFQNFVVGPSNQLANAASIAIANEPGRRYNPLFIYGGVGLGKTHLINAIGHQIIQHSPEANIMYLSAERFTNEFISALQNQQINEFRDRYRSQIDAILIDDIQFLATREQTQEEFFHTFNALYHLDKQIVVSCDVYPQQIGEMEERLVSRFQWGMVADIQAPDLDTRVAIVKMKADQEGIDLSNDVAAFLAEIIKSNVRELEGSLLRLAVKAELLNRTIDIDFAREALRASMPTTESVTTVEEIQQAVCDYFNIRLAQIKSNRRHRSITQPRMIAMYICRQHLGTSYTELGWRFGGKDHTTIINAVRKISSLVENNDQSICASIEAIERKLNINKP